MNPTINPAYAAALSDTTRNTNSFTPSAAQQTHAHDDTNNEGTAPAISNDKGGDNQSIAGSIGSWDDSDAEGAKSKPSNYQANTTATDPIKNTTNADDATSPQEAPAAAPAQSDAAASYQNRNPVLPQWTYDRNTNTTTTTNPPSTNSAPSSSYAAPTQSYENPIHQNSAAPSNTGQSGSSSHKSYYYPPHRPSPSHHQYHNSSSSNSSYNNYYSQSSSSSHHRHYHHPSSSGYSTHHSYNHHQPQYHHHHHHHHHHDDNRIEIPPDHTPTWQHILPPDYFKKRKEQRYNNQYGRSRRKFILSLINLWEFTVTTQSIDMYGSSTEEIFHGLRGPIKKIAKDHIGKDGRKGAIFERGAGGEGIMPDDPSLKQAVTERFDNEDDTTGNNATNNNNVGKGKWRIPLGAYQALFSYLTREGSVEGIAPEQLRVATLGRERADKKEYPSVKWLLEKGVSTVVAEALAPYQRGGVEFIIEKEGKALLADEMGLGKTIQAIAAMSAFRKDWPLLVLCPSTARYHWETEFRHWMGRESQSALTSSNKANGNNNNNNDHGPEVLKNSQINVLTSGKDRILKADNSTKVVICSIGLIVNLVNSHRIVPGMFRATIVDESHVLKNKATKRTKAVLPLLEAAERCLLLSGTPALAKPSELWPQLSVLGGRRDDGSRYPSGIMCDYEDFMSKYVRGQSKTRLAELHTLLTSTVMIRRMKADMLKNLPPKIREKAFIKVEDQRLQSEFTFYLRMLKEGKGLLGKLARTHEIGDISSGAQQFIPENGDEPLKNKEVLHHLYNLSGRCKVARITKMLKNWLNDPTKGKLCIFAHHLYVLDELARGAGLSNFIEGMAKFIRIDGSTSPKSRQEQILTFQTDPTVRIALLGITAAGVAVTLTASSTVWFAELFWTPAIMVQAEDRCHRIGQQATVRCLYFVAKGTLDEVLWKLIEKKFRDLGEFVEGKENMGIALERELEDDEEDEILKVEEAPDEAESRKRKAENLFEDLLDTDDLELKAEIDELVHEEEEMLIVKGDDEDLDPDTADGRETPAPPVSTAVNSSSNSGAERSKPSNNAIILLDDDDDDEDKKAMTFSMAMQRMQDGTIQRFESSVRCVSENMKFRDIRYPAYKSLGLLMVSFGGRVCIKGYTTPQDVKYESLNRPQIGAIIIAVNEVVIPQNANFSKVLAYMRKLVMQGPLTLVFAEDKEFMPWFKKVMIPRFDAQLQARNQAKAQAQNSNAKKEVIDLLDD